MKRIAGPYGTDYRIGDYVAIKEDEWFHGDPEGHDGAESSSDVTWGAVPADLYEQRQGYVGLPDAAFEAGTLRELRARIERSQ